MSATIVPIVPDSSSEGNTNTSLEKENKKKQISPSKNWCFTFNNYDESEYERILFTISSNSSKYIIGKEVGESGTPHLQGYFEWPRKIRPCSLGLSNKIHFEKARGGRADNIAYCSKDGKFVTNCHIPKPIKTLKLEQLYEWQQVLLELLTTTGDDERTIYWVFDEDGNTGKSAFCKYLCFNEPAIMVDGRSQDIMNGISNYIEKEGMAPEIVCIDCPRHNVGFMNYGAIEKVKNGHCFNSKYESKQLIFNSPAVVVFANSPPDTEKYSLDRWCIYQIVNKELENYE